MKRMLTCSLVAALLAGCQNDRLTTTTTYGDSGTIVTTVADRATELGKAYYNQPNMAKVIEIEGTNLTFSVSGASRFCLSCPVPTKQIMPRETAWYDGLADVIKTAAPWIFMAYWVNEGNFGSNSSSSSTTTTTNNN